MVEVTLLHYTFLFRQLHWREEFALKPGKEDPTRFLLATALDSVSGLKIEKLADALRIFQNIPMAVIKRAYVIYRYKLPQARSFTTRGLYKAPNPASYQARVYETQEQRDEAGDVLTRQMEKTFGRAEVREAQAVEQEIVRNSGKKGAVKRSPDA